MPQFGAVSMGALAHAPARLFGSRPGPATPHPARGFAPSRTSPPLGFAERGEEEDPRAEDPWKTPGFGLKTPPETAN
jgi:hypothetical protein